MMKFSRRAITRASCKKREWYMWTMPNVCGLCLSHWSSGVSFIVIVLLSLYALTFSIENSADNSIISILTMLNVVVIDLIIVF